MRISHRFGAMLAWLCLVTPLSAAQAPAPKWGELEQAVGKEDYVEARKLADAILQRGSPPDRLKTTVIYGRILLALGDKDQAKQYLATLAKPGNDPTGGQMTAIYGAWFTALDGKPDEGIKALEKVLENKAHNETTAEAADVLAMLYMVRGDQEKAKKTVDFGLGVLQYMGKKDGYLVTLLQGRLNSNITAGEAKRLYDAAEKLRAEKKFAEAGQAFAAVCNKFPKNEWAHASGFRMGECLLGLDHPSQAVTHWQKFIKESPAGPWRGQAHVAMIDLTLESLDLKKATELTMTASATLAKIGEKGAVPLREAPKGLSPSSTDDTSWKEAAYDIYLRQGIVSLVDGRFDAAAQAFEQTKQNLPSPASGRGAGGEGVPLDRLIEAAKQKAKLVPDELGVGDDRAVVALALGNIYNILHQYDIAKGYFTLPLSGPMRSRSAAHRSFAGLGLARVLVATGGGPAAISPKKAKDTGVPASPLLPAAVAYEASIKEYPSGSWHDETLRELALLTERIAAESGQLSVASGQKTATSKSTNPAPLSDATQQQQKKAIVAARIKAVPYWQNLRQQYPTSRYVPQALYHVGLLNADAEKPDEALAAFEELTKKYPDSPWTGDAQVWLIDVKLEHQFDLPGASSLAEAAVDWYEHLDQAKATEARKGLGNDQSDALRSLQQIGYDIYIRAGLVEYLNESGKGKAEGGTSDSTSLFSRAIAFFEKAKPLQPARDFVVVQGHIPTGIERLIEAAKSGKSLTPEVVRQGDETARLILMLADVYHEGAQWQRSLDLCTRVIDSAAPKASREQKSYAHYRRARNYYSLDGKDNNPDAAFKDYATAVRAAPKAPWADDAMFLAANVQWNDKRDPNSAVELWRRLLHSYPNSKEADRSAYYIGVAYEWSNRPAEADRAYQEFLEKRPGSRFATEASRRLTEVQKQEQEAKGKKAAKATSTP